MMTTKAEPGQSAGMKRDLIAAMLLVLLSYKLQSTEPYGGRALNV